MSFSYAPRITLPFSDLSGVIQEWAEHAQKVACFEHPADLKVKHTHCHLLLLDTDYKTAEQFKRIFYKHYPQDQNPSYTGKDFWAWTNRKYPNPNMNFIIYMTKGIHSAKILKNISPADVEALRAKWVDPTPKEESLTERKESTKTKAELLNEMLELIDDDDQKGVYDNKVDEYLADGIVKVVLKVLRKNNIIIGRFKVREYRDAIMYFNPNFESRFINFVNQDFKKSNYV